MNLKRPEGLQELAPEEPCPANLCALFEIDPAQKNVISLVGSGGKTTLLFALAKELARAGKRVAVTTTTHIFYPDSTQCAQVMTSGSDAAIAQALEKDGMVTVGSIAEEGKLSAPAPELLEKLYRMVDTLLLEADGSRRLPIKITNEREPILYEKTNKIIAVAGMSAFGKPIAQVCHRALLAQKLLRVDAEHLVTPQDMAALLEYSYGQYGKITVMLNQADCDFLRNQAEIVAKDLLKSGVKRVVISSFLSQKFTGYHAD